MLPPLATIVDLALAILVIEAVALGVLRRNRPAGSIAGLIPHLLAGAFLLLALRFAVTESGPALILGALALGGLSHLWDVATLVKADRGR